MTFRNPNLVPTPIVNRNGVVTTVHRKLGGSGQTAAFSKNGPPSPSAYKPSDEAMVDTIDSTIRNLPAAPDRANPFNALQREKLLGSAHIEGHLQRVNALFAGLRADGEYGFNTAMYLLMNVNLADANQVRILNAHKGDFGDRYSDWRATAKLGADLVARGVTTLGSDDRIATLPAHIRANEEYEKALLRHAQDLWDGLDEDAVDYVDNGPYAVAVEKHAKDIEKIIEYRGDPEDRDSRGYNDAINIAPFDTEDLEAYLSQGAVADGWL